MVNHNPSQSLTGNEEVIKCVLVGDSGVGKTCLSCAFACGLRYKLQKLVKTHQATVWAQDHYQLDKEILERSWCDIDGCQVSIRLWDTFGYHDKDRRFAYRGADVVVLCFNVMNARSLRNVHRIWYPEIRRFSPGVPIVLCGTQADMRYMIYDENFLGMQKGVFYRPTRHEDMIPPSVGRNVAKEIGAPYYETSVLTHHGVADVIINAARAALLERRKFWNTQLRRVQRPLLQPPMKVPLPAEPKIEIAKPLLKSDISALLTNKSECDVTFLVGNTMIDAHRICLVVASEFFQSLFSVESLAKLPARRRHRSDHLRSQFPQRFSSNSESECLLDSCSDQDSLSTIADYDSSVQGSSSGGEFFLSNQYFRPTYPLVIPYDHEAVEVIEIRYEESPSDPTHGGLKSYVQMSEQISVVTFNVIVEYLYTGCLHPHGVSLEDIKDTAELLQLKDLVRQIKNTLKKQEYLNIEMEQTFHDNRISKLRELALHKDFLSDISFEVDNGGIVLAHKALLMGRCEMMYAMFSSDFIESASDVIPFSGVTVETFHALQEYLYTGEAPGLNNVDCLALIEMANRLCLPRLVNMVEGGVALQLRMCQDKEELLGDVLTLMMPAELYSATQLSRLCQHFLCVNYEEVRQNHEALFQSLPSDKKEIIEQKRWPPVWYLKEAERHDRLSQHHFLPLTRPLVQDYNTRCGCLCFSKRRKHKLRDSVELPI